MSAKDDLLALLKSSGYAQQEAGWGPVAFGSDGRTYAARTARALEKDGLAKLRYGPLKSGRDGWAWWLDRAPQKTRKTKE